MHCVAGGDRGSYGGGGGGGSRGPREGREGDWTCPGYVFTHITAISPKPAAVHFICKTPGLILLGRLFTCCTVLSYPTVICTYR